MSYKRLKWDEKSSVNNPELDAHHQQLCVIANRILDLAENPETTPDKLLLQLTELGNHVFYHFDAEEKYLKEMHFPEAVRHLEAHKRYRQEIQSFISEIREQQKVCKDRADCLTAANRVAQFVSDWVSNHMLGGADTEKFFAKHRDQGKPGAGA